MRMQIRLMVTLGVLVFLVGGLYLFSDWFSKTTGYVLGEDQQIRFVGCLNTKSTALYMKNDCVDCFKQEQIFAPRAYEMIEKVNCDDPNNCLGIKSLPAWQANGELHYGIKDFQELAEISGCKIS